MDTSRRLKAGTQASFAGTSIGHAGHCVPADLLAAQRPLVLQCQGNGDRVWKASIPARPAPSTLRFNWADLVSAQVPADSLLRAGREATVWRGRAGPGRAGSGLGFRWRR